MKQTFFLICAVFVFCSFTSADSCERDVRMGDELWTFHRMEDGNSYHELILKEQFEEGTSLKLQLPCEKRYVDAVQVQWGKQSKKMHAELVVYPGEKNLGRSIRKSERQETWAVHQRSGKIEFRFFGPRDKDVKIRWIRVFYGADQHTIKPH